ncbi:MAG: YafY family transcriptional regulator [Anaerolineales bacterium]|nr:YafY family transcriptional regulator [Anaerolineales bacterium]MCX7607939.1 YafY family transcriptional regulator [Anaerolineales bacterium]MDW8226364.1 YafY family protein [Anaerolineales bacterium]
MPRADRLFSLVEFLKLHPYASMERLCREFGVTPRTIYRDIRGLQERSVFIEFDAERGGYYLASKSYIQSLRFSPEEVLVIQMALTARPMQKTLFGRAAQSALSKIEAATFSTIETSPDAINASFVLEPSSLTDYSEFEDIFNTLQRAWMLRRTAEIEYDSKSDPPDTPRIRQVDVYGAFTEKSKWYVVGYCHHSKEVRTFKMIRIRQARLTERSYTLPDTFSIEEYVREAWSLFRGEPKVNVAARFSPRVAHLVLEEKHHPTQQVEAQADGSVILRARVAGWREFGWWLRQFGDDVEALEPPELRAEFARLGKKFREMYGSD